jgi:glyoxylase-like metal-dependent hydrolase (beta-lactamase superfamily II)
MGDESYEVLLIPLHGHTPGHCGVAVRTLDRWLLLSGDEAYPFYNEQWVQAYGRPPEWLIRLAGVGTHMPRLISLWREHGDQIRFMFSHDGLTFAELQTETS